MVKKILDVVYGPITDKMASAQLLVTRRDMPVSAGTRSRYAHPSRTTGETHIAQI